MAILVLKVVDNGMQNDRVLKTNIFVLKWRLSLHRQFKHLRT